MGCSLIEDIFASSLIVIELCYLIRKIKSVLVNDSFSSESLIMYNAVLFSWLIESIFIQSNIQEFIFTCWNLARFIVNIFACFRVICVSFGLVTWSYNNIIINLMNAVKRMDNVCEPVDFLTSSIVYVFTGFLIIDEITGTVV